jgi:hypothetical protein
MHTSFVFFLNLLYAICQFVCYLPICTLFAYLHVICLLIILFTINHRLTFTQDISYVIVQVQAEAANALNVVCRESANNQNFIISIGGIPPLVKLVQSNNIEVRESQQQVQIFLMSHICYIVVFLSKFKI